MHSPGIHRKGNIDVHLSVSSKSPPNPASIMGLGYANDQRSTFTSNNEDSIVQIKRNSLTGRILEMEVSRNWNKYLKGVTC